MLDSARRPYCLHLLAHAQSPDPVDAYVQAEMQKRHIPGLALLVIRDGQAIKQQGYGLANVELQVPVKPETIFQSGSMGKQFTATAVMMLVEEGKVSLDDPLTKFFPEAPAAWKNVKVRHLLSHTGGFTDYPDKFDFRRDYTEDDLLKIVEALPLSFPPGSKWAYSNLGYLTLGILIHRVTGQFYGDFLHDRIFQPLGMQTRIISEADIIPNRAAGYRLVKGELKNQEWVSPTLEHHRGRRALLQHSRPGQMGCRPLHRETAQALQPRTDVDAREAQRRQAEFRPLRIRLVHQRRRVATASSNTAAPGRDSPPISPATLTTSLRSSCSPISKAGTPPASLITWLASTFRPSCLPPKEAEKD